MTTFVADPLRSLHLDEDPCPHCGQKAGALKLPFFLTYWYEDMWEAVQPGRGTRELIGLTGEQSLPILEVVVQRLDALEDDRKARLYCPIERLREAIKVCRDYPKATWRH